jgi:hypothetical protein
MPAQQEILQFGVWGKVSGSSGIEINRISLALVI